MKNIFSLNKLRFLALTSVVLMAPGLLQAQFIVCKSGDYDYESIQEAIADLGDYNMIQVRDGTYEYESTMTIDNIGIILEAYPGHSPVYDGGSSDPAINILQSGVIIRGLEIRGSGSHGIMVQGHSATVEMCEIHGFVRGIHIGLGPGHFDTDIRRNIIRDNNIGVNIDGGSAKFYRNVFDNPTNVQFANAGGTWHDGDPLDPNTGIGEEGGGGNYWSDYGGEDRGDGIGDTPYVMSDFSSGEVQDDFPWMSPDFYVPAGSFDVAVTDITAGESPDITITALKDMHDNNLLGDLSVTIEINGASETEEMNFYGGPGGGQADTYTWPAPVTTSGELTATVTIDGAVETGLFTVDSSAAIGCVPSVEDITAGESPEIRIYDAQDAYGNLLEGEYSATLTIDGTIKTPDLNFTGGEATFEWDSMTAAGGYELEAVIDGIPDFALFTVMPSSAVDFIVSVDNITAGESPQIHIFGAHDTYGNLLEGEYQSSINIIFETKTPDLNFTGGAATFEWDPMTTPDTPNAEVSIDGVARSDFFEISHGPPDYLLVYSSPDGIIAGNTQSFFSDAFDEYGNNIGFVTDETVWSIEPEAGGSWDDNIYTSEFSGDWTVTGTYDGDITGTASLSVRSAGVVEFNLSVSDITAGESPRVQISEARDGFGNLLGGEYQALITIDGIQQDPDLTFTGGSASFDWDPIETAFIYDAEVSIGPVTETDSFNVSPGAPALLDVLPNTAEITAGETREYYADAFDEHGNSIGDVTAVTVWTIEPGAGGSWDDNIYTSEFSGDWTVTGTYGEITGTASLGVGSAGVSEFNLSVDDISAGESPRIQISEVRDGFGNLFEGNQTVNITVYRNFIPDGNQWPTLNFESGAASHDWWLTTTPGEYEAEVSIGSVLRTDSFHVSPGPPAVLVVYPNTAEITAGETREYYAEVFDEYENPVGTVTNETDWSIEPGAGGSWNEYIYTSRFSGDWTVTGTYEGITGTASLRVNSAAPADLSVETQPGDTGAGEEIPGPPEARVADEFGNPVPGVGVTVSIQGGGDFDGGDDTAVTNAAGIASFTDLVINSMGSYNLVFNSDGLDPAVSDDFNITSAAAYSLAFVQHPSDAAAGETITPAVSVRVKDAYGNFAETADNMITLSIDNDPSEGAVLKGTVERAAVDGAAEFSDINIEIAASGYTLSASAAGLEGAESDSFNITAASPAVLSVETQPGDTTAGQAIAGPPEVKAVDEFGNPVPGAEVEVSIKGGGDFAAGLLTADTGPDGIADFTGLVIARPGDYQLVFSAAGAADAESSVFTVNDIEIEVTGVEAHSAVIRVLDADKLTALKSQPFKFIASTSTAFDSPVETGWFEEDEGKVSGLKTGTTYWFKAVIRFESGYEVKTATASAATVLVETATGGFSETKDDDDGKTTISVPSTNFPVYALLGAPEPDDETLIDEANNKLNNENFNTGIISPISFSLKDDKGEDVDYSTAFSDPDARIVLRLYYEEDLTAKELDGLRMARLNRNTSEWELIDRDLVTVNHSEKWVEARLESLSIYSLVIEPASAVADLSDVFVYPNPYKPSQGHAWIKFDNLGGETKIQIMTISGDLVFEAKGITGSEFEWNARNDSGREVASGVYIALITNEEGESKVLRLAVLR